MASIQPIEGRSVHRIQSGQVIVDLCSVVKELVENSLDAGATAIDVRFKNHGLGSIEVQDNGSGIAKDDYESIGLKHFTSKLRSYEDLSELHTFGFRGEALSSLCALADVHILTAREDEAPKGSRLDFETSGKLKGTQVIAAQRGTTVAVETIFKNLPVRRQELEKNIKREYGKVLNLLQAYACIGAGVKISVSNVAGKKKTVVFSTKSNKTTRENIANVFGAKALSALTALDLSFELQSSVSSSHDETDQKRVKIAGHVSKPIVGEGRQTPDRQMFFVNSRPCALPQVAKVMNEVYKNYNITQSPFIFANVMLDTNAYDVNVSPDKRTILLHEQTALLDSIKTSLTELFDNQVQTVPLSQAPTQRSSVQSRLVGLQSAQQTARQTTQGSQEDLADDENVDAGSDISAEAESTASASHLPGSVKSSFTQGTREPFVAGARDVSEKSSPGPSGEAGKVPIDRLMSGGNESPIDASRSKGLEIDDTNGKSSRDQDKSPTRNVRDGSSEVEIPSVTTTPVKRPPGVVPNAFDRMRPLRTPSEIATVTIGNNTTTARIGSSSTRWPKTSKSNRMRVTRPPTNSASKFGNSLKAFAAPGTQDDFLDEDGLSDNDDDSIESSSAQSEQVPRQPSVEEDEAVSDSDDEAHLGSTEETRQGDDGGGTEEDDDDDEENVMSPEGSDQEYFDEEAKKANEEVRVAKLIREAEKSLASPTEDSERRARKLLKGGHKDATTKISQNIDISVDGINRQCERMARTEDQLQLSHLLSTRNNPVSSLDSSTDDIAAAEERLSLTVSKADFDNMRVVGQFNLGFIIAVRPSTSSPASSLSTISSDELFIIDQHASDEKYNFERLQATTVVQSQRLVRPQTLQLTAIEEEIAIDHVVPLQRNGYIITIADESNTQQATDIFSSQGEGEEVPSTELPVGVVGTRVTLHALPAHSFKNSSSSLSAYLSSSSSPALRDLDELLAILPENPHARPASVRKVLAMRACRSSIMVGKALTLKRMEGVVRHMGGMDKPWNCPHGRPTMRHLGGLEALFAGKDGRDGGAAGSWVEGMGVVGMAEDRKDSYTGTDLETWMQPDGGVDWGLWFDHGHTGYSDEDPNPGDGPEHDRSEVDESDDEGGVEDGE